MHAAYAELQCMHAAAHAPDLHSGCLEAGALCIEHSMLYRHTMRINIRMLRTPHTHQLQLLPLLLAGRCCNPALLLAVPRSRWCKLAAASVWPHRWRVHTNRSACSGAALLPLTSLRPCGPTLGLVAALSSHLHTRDGHTVAGQSRPVTDTLTTLLYHLHDDAKEPRQWSLGATGAGMHMGHADTSNSRLFWSPGHQHRTLTATLHPEWPLRLILWQSHPRQYLQPDLAPLTVLRLLR
jgi:hypothetical protein